MAVVHSATNLTISWTLADGAAVTGYGISYSNTDTQCFTDSDTVTGIAAGEISHTLTDLEEATEYTITVTALLAGGESVADNIIATTLAAGELTCTIIAAGSDLALPILDGQMNNLQN